MSQMNETLAVLGGNPVSKSPLEAPAWPPVDSAVAERLKDVYFSREWSFSSPSEQKFAADYAAYHDAKYGIFMANGTVTLQASMIAMGIGAGDEVIVPSMTWIATASAVAYVGAKPVIADVEPTTLCLDPAKFEEAITPRTKAVIPVHIYGSMADMEAILEIAARHGLRVIEDCAHMQGGKWNGRGVGSWGDVGSFSFQQSKTVASGEGGICITNDEELAEKLYRVKHIGYTAAMTQGEAVTGPEVGMLCHNFRATAFQAEILSGQLAHLESLIRTYNKNVDRLTARLESVPGVRIQSPGRLADPQGFYGLAFIFDGEPTADIPINRICEAAAAEGLRPGRTYGPVYNLVLFNFRDKDYRIEGGRCAVCEDIATERTMTLSHPILGSDEKTIDAIGEIIAKVVANADALRKMEYNAQPV